MPVTLSLTESQILAALRAFLLDILPPGTEVVKAQVNRVPQVPGQNFVVMTPLIRARLSTNEDSYNDAAVTGSITGTTLTISAVDFGAIIVGSPVYGVDVLPGTTVTALGTGTGGVGTYTVSPSQTVTSRALYAGTTAMRQATRVTMQLDLHGPAAADNCQRFTTAFRDDYGVLFFGRTGLQVAPLYADEPRQMPFFNGEQQVEDRWVIDAVLQANPIVTVPQEFAAELDVTLHNVP